MDVHLKINSVSGFEFVCVTDNVNIIEWTGSSKTFPMNRIANFFSLFGSFLADTQQHLDFTELHEQQKTSRGRLFCGNISISDIQSFNLDISTIYSNLFSAHKPLSEDSQQLWIFTYPKVMKICWDTLNYLYSNIVYGCILVDPLEIHVWRTVRGNYAGLTEAAIHYATGKTFYTHHFKKIFIIIIPF